MLVVGAQDGVHPGLPASSLGPEPVEHVGVDPQARVDLAPLGRRDPRLLPETLVDHASGRVRRRPGLTAIPHVPKLGERVALGISCGHARSLSRR